MTPEPEPGSAASQPVPAQPEPRPSAGPEPSAEPRLLPTEAERALAEAVREFLADHAEAGRPAGDAPTRDPDRARTLWTSFARQLGVTNLLVPAEAGGAGGTARDAAVVLIELGRSLAALPYLTSAVTATRAWLASGAPLPAGLAAGTAVAVLALPAGTGPAAAGPGSGPPPWLTVSDGRVRGQVPGVADADLADLLLVPARTADGWALYTVDASDPAVVVEPVTSFDPTRPVADLRLDGPPATRLATGEAARRAVEAGLVAGAALLAAEQLGVAEWCLDTTVGYARQRHQFGRPIGSFQAVKHRLADLWAGIATGRAVAAYAASMLDTDEARVATGLAQAYCGPLAVRAAEECVQLHGAIGMTWEHPAHWYLKRAKADSVVYGSVDEHREWLAGLVELPAPGTG